jgi:hypothetical protein
MSTVSIRLIVIREDVRADAVLADVATRLGLPGLAPDEHGNVYVRLQEDAGGDGWQRLRDALDASGHDWWAYLHLPRHAEPGAPGEPPGA